jgi:hypothetical protein
MPLKGQVQVGLEGSHWPVAALHVSPDGQSLFDWHPVVPHPAPPHVPVEVSPQAEAQPALEQS